MAAVLAVAGCTRVNTLPVWEAPARQGGPLPVTLLLPVADDTPVGDPHFLGKGLREYMAIGPLFFPPFGWGYEAFRADAPRSEVVRRAALSLLTQRGIPVVERTAPTPEGSRQDDDFLGLAIRIHRLEVDTAKAEPLLLVIVTGIHWPHREARVALSCQVWRPGTTGPLWEGNGRGLHAYPRLHDAVDGAVLQALAECVDNSKLAQTRADLARARSRRLVATGNDLALAGKSLEALGHYRQAYAGASTAEEQLAAIEAMSSVIRSKRTAPLIEEEARKYKVQGDAAVREKRFTDAVALYAKAIDIAPWWEALHFNQALVRGEIGEWERAIQSMKGYLLLSPDAPNARAAQDRIYEWQAKAGL